MYYNFIKIMLVKKITLGLAQSDKNYGYGSKQKDKFFELINFALENGISRLDTAPNYKNSDNIISRLNTKNLNISSKVPLTEVKTSELPSFINRSLDNIFENNKIHKLENLFFL